MSTVEEKKEIASSERPSKFSTRIYKRAGFILLALAFSILFLTFAPALKEEVRYQLVQNEPVRPVITRKEAEEKKLDEKAITIPVDEGFGIVIPKIGANAKVIEGVNWQDPMMYQRALTKGVAHAEGTSLPGEEGNVFIFAHSGIDFYEAARYNAVFYLIEKLETGDEIDIFYQGRKYMYVVVEKKMVGAEAVEYLESDTSSGETVTLMTCWPPGTTVKRLIVRAERKS